MAHTVNVNLGTDIKWEHFDCFKLRSKHIN